MDLRLELGNGRVVYLPDGDHWSMTADNEYLSPKLIGQAYQPPETHSKPIKNFIEVIATQYLNPEQGWRFNSLYGDDDGPYVIFTNPQRKGLSESCPKDDFINPVTMTHSDDKNRWDVRTEPLSEALSGTNMRVSYATWSYNTLRFNRESRRFFRKRQEEVMIYQKGVIYLDIWLEDVNQLCADAEYDIEAATQTYVANIQRPAALLDEFAWLRTDHPVELFTQKSEPLTK